jgi:uncharacterized protein YutE (UPF0331/DUF86 family)
MARALDRETVIQHLSMLEQNIMELEAYKNVTFAEFCSSSRNYWSVERGMQLCIQNILDIGAHLLAGLALANPAEYRDVILDMGKHGIIPREFADKISPMAGFRNILVHEYLKVDLAQVYEKLQTGLDDFRTFTRYVALLLKDLEKE